MLAVGTAVGRYRILAPLGSGGMGEVYRARDTRLARDVAIKVVLADVARDPERIKRFEHEARVAGALNHPNVCAVLDLGMHDGSPFVVMELLQGWSLREQLMSGALPVRKAIDYAAQVAHGLAAVHETGIVHRDLKPENLFITRDGRVKVLDFGLAKLTRPEVLTSASDPTISIPTTESGTILGTAGYMAPEQARGLAADARSDLFALGAILHEMLTGQRAFRGGSFVETLHAILNDEPAPLSASGREIPPFLGSIVARCLEKSPAKRFQSASDLAFNLESMSGSGAMISAMGPENSPVRGETSRFRALVPYLTGVLLMSVVAVGAALVTHHFEPPADASHQIYHRLSLRRGWISNARFSGDGKSVFYTAMWEGGEPEIYETKSGSTASHPLDLPRMNLLSVARDGTLAVTLAHAGIADPATLAEVPVSGGAPRPVLDDVLAADWAPNAGVLAVTHRVGAKMRLEMPPGKALYETDASLRYVRVSPDGKWLAVIENPIPGDTRGSVAILDGTGHVASRTVEWNTLAGLAWSRDSREVWFSASQDMATGQFLAFSPGGELRVVSAFPGWNGIHDIGPDGQVLLTRTNMRVGIRGRASTTDQEHELGWLDNPAPRDISSDGKILLFDEVGIGGGTFYSTCLRGMDGSPPVRLGEGRGCSLSPDGRWVLTMQFRPPNHLLLLPTGTGDSTSIPRGPIVAYRDARWLPDGKRFLFIGSEQGHAPRTYVQAVSGGMPRAITPEGTGGVLASPDGQFVAAVSGDRDLSVWPINGGAPRQISKLLPAEEVYQWTRDGRFLYVGLRGTGAIISKIDLVHGVRTPWKTFNGNDPAGFIFMSFVLTPEGEAYAYRYVTRLHDLYVATGIR
jgi:eukaryotic-like serine/threonine-protein kinase